MDHSKPAEPAWLEQGAAHVFRPYCQHRTAAPPLPVVGARGSRLVLADGRELVDGTASWWTAAHGYGHPHVLAKVQEQLLRLPHVALGGLAHEAAYSLAARIAGMLPEPLGHVFFTESGSVAVEVALKMAIQASDNRGRPRRTLVSFDGAYHGDTFATMSLSDPSDGMHRAFRGSGPPAVHLPLPHQDDGGAFEAAFSKVGDGVACAIIEPLVQCAGGMRMHGPDVLRRVRRSCDEHGALLVFDEIATGFFRTGRCFALEEANVVPDVVVIGKALSGGTLPLAAAVASRAVFEAFFGDDGTTALQHGPTYMGNALACAAAQASLDLFAASDYPAKVVDLERTLRARLIRCEDLPHVVDVRVKGAIAAVEMDPGTAPPSEAFIAEGAFIRPLRLHHADVVYLMPPLVIEGGDLDVLIRAIEVALGGSRRLGRTR